MNTLAEVSHENYFLRFDLKAENWKHRRKIKEDLHEEQGCRNTRMMYSDPKMVC